MLRFPRAVRARAVLVASCLAVVTPAFAVPASITADGLLFVEGERMFPLGLLELGSDKYPDWDQRVQDAEANLVWDVEVAYADTTPTCAQVIQAARDGGYYLMIGAGDTWNWDDLATPELEVDQRLYEPEDLAAAQACIAPHPEQVVAWANRDEPVWTIARNQIGDIDEAHVHDTYDQLHASLASPIVAMNFAPVHVSEDLDTWKADVASYTTATDIVMFAAYPYPPGPGTCSEFNVLGFPNCPLDRLVTGQDIFLAELNDPGQPLWMIIQAFKEIPLKEARWEAYASIVHGATGILWAGWNWVHPLGNGDDTWPVIRQVISEVSELQEFLVGHDISGVQSDQVDVEVRGLEWEDRVVVFAVSRNGYTGPATIQLPGLQHPLVSVLNEGRQLDATGSVITDTFDAYEAHVYRYRLLHGVPFPDAPDVASPSSERFTAEAFPNPSDGRATVRFRLPRAASALFTVYDASGRQVAVIGRGSFRAGVVDRTWNGRDLTGRPVAPGTYFVRGRTSDGAVATTRVVIRR